MPTIASTGGLQRPTGCLCFRIFFAIDPGLPAFALSCCSVAASLFYFASLHKKVGLANQKACQALKDFINAMVS